MYAVLDEVVFDHPLDGFLATIGGHYFFLLATGKTLTTEYFLTNTVILCSFGHDSLIFGCDVHELIVINKSINITFSQNVSYLYLINQLKIKVIW